MDAALEQRIAERIRSQTSPVVPKAPARKVLEILEAPKKIAAPNSCPEPFAGPMETLFRLSISVQHRPQPDLTIGAALAAMSACLHGRYATEDGLRGNLYVIGLAGTGAGKSGPLDLVKTVVEVAGGTAMSNIGSGQGIEDALRRADDRRAALVIDEVAHMIGAFSSSKSADYQAAAGKALLELYSSSSSTQVTRMLADEDKQPIPLFHPHVTMYGTTTHHKMQGISPSLIDDGTLGRCLVVTGKDFVHMREDINGSRLYPALDASLGSLARSIFKFGPAMSRREDNVKYFPLDAEAKETISRTIRHFDRVAERADGPNRALCARAVEQIKRISLVLAVWDRSDLISRKHVAWAANFVAYSHHCLLQFVEQMTDNPIVAAAQRVEKIMRDAINGKAPFGKGQFAKFNVLAQQTGNVGHSALLKASKLDVKQFLDVMRHLEQDGSVEPVETETGASRGPSLSRCYRISQ